MNDKIKKEIIDVINTVRIYIQGDGGDLEFIDYKDNVVTVKLLGACVGCVGIDSTYKDGLESILKDEINPNITLKLIEE